MTAPIHLLLGPVGAGKSTRGLQLKKELRGVLFDLDHWMTALYGDDERPKEGRMEWYLERRDRTQAQIWRTAQQTLDAETPVILELGLIRRDDRDKFVPQLLASGHPVTVHLLDAPRDVRRQRVMARNEEKGATFSMPVPPEVFEMASDFWQPPEDDEFAACDVVVV